MVRPPRSPLLTAAFWARPTLVVARELVGCVVETATPVGTAAGRIVEVEAYLGPDDPASHAARGPTPRAAIMFGPPGRAYVYFIYGMHHCLNFVTERPGTAGAVLVRALEPLAGRELMAHRRWGAGPARADEELCNGPGKLCQALGIDLGWNGEPLRGPRLRLRAPTGERPSLAVTTRIGVRQAADRPWRFVVAGSRCLSVPLARRPGTALI